MKKIAFCISVLLGLGSLTAQTNAISTNMSFYDMNSNFENNMSECIPFGLSIGFLRSVAESPFSFGVEAGATTYGSEEYNVEFRGQDVAMIEEHSFFSISTFSRYNVLENTFSKVYGEARIGMNGFYGTSHSADCIEEVGTETNYHGSTYNVGLGGGIMINPSQLFNQEESSLWIDFNVVTAVGSTLEYNRSRDSEMISTEKSRGFESATNSTAFKVGLVMVL